MNITIVVEQINREMDNALLLKSELIRREHKVNIKYRWEDFSLTQCDVLIIPNCYRTEQYEEYRYRYYCSSGIIIDLQSEQVLSKDDYESGVMTPTGRALLAKHICWGKDYYDYLVSQNVPPEVLRICGSIQMDLLRPIFNDFWKTKNELSEEFSLPKHKKWILYVSSFSMAFNDLMYSKTVEFLGRDFTENYRKISEFSQVKTNEWFDKLLSESDDYIVIYRPHPDEIESDCVKNLSKKYPDRFRIINQYGIKQWIISCDLIATWISTAVSECYFANKNVLILRPVPVPDNIDIAIFNGCSYIDSYKKFYDNLINFENFKFPIDEKLINNTFDIDKTPTYVKICNFIQELKDTADESVNEVCYEKNRIKYLLTNKVIISTILKKIYRCLYSCVGLRISNKKLRGKYFIEDWEKRAQLNKANKMYIKDSYKRINRIINSMKS